jgi:hypothetical protein
MLLRDRTALVRQQYCKYLASNRFAADCAGMHPSHGMLLGAISLGTVVVGSTIWKSGEQWLRDQQIVP